MLWTIVLPEFPHPPSRVDGVRLFDEVQEFINVNEDVAEIGGEEIVPTDLRTPVEIPTLLIACHGGIGRPVLHEGNWFNRFTFAPAILLSFLEKACAISFVTDG